MIKRIPLFLVLYGLCLGIGYPTLNRYDLDSPAIADSSRYRTMVDSIDPSVPEPFRYRVVVPLLARGPHAVFERLPLGSWNREMLALLLVNAFFVALTGMVLMRVARALSLDESAILVTPFLYVCSFGVVNVMLAGFVDSVEACVITLTIAATLERRWWVLPILFALGAAGKETSLLFAALYVATYLIVDRRITGSVWTAWAAAIGLGLLVLFGVRAWVGLPPGTETLQLRPAAEWPAGLIAILRSGAWVYTFAVLIPLGLPRIRRLPRPLIAASLATAACALLVSGWAQIADNASRPIFDTIGPMLCLSGAILLSELVSEQS